MAYIEERDGRFTVRWSFKGHKHRSKPFNSRKAAEKARREVEDCVAAGRSWPPDDVPQAPRMLEVGGAWLADCARLNRSDSTRTGYAVQVSRWVDWLQVREGLTDADGVTARHFSQANLTDFQSWLARPKSEGGGGLTSRSAAVYSQTVVRLWIWAFQTDRFGAQVPPPRPPTIVVPDPTFEPYAPTWAQMDAAVQAGRLLRNDWVWRVLLIMRCTGLRAGQVFRLQWRDIDLDAGLMHIRPELGKSRQERRGRIVPIAPVLLADLTTWPRLGERVIHRAPRTLDQDAVVRAWELAGVPLEARRQPLHCMRRGFLSGLAAAGVSLEVRQILVGHSSGVTRDTYIPDRAFAETLRAAVALVPPLQTVEGITRRLGRRTTRWNRTVDPLRTHPTADA